MADIGQQANTYYYCGGSSTYDSDIRPAFSHYGYSSNAWQYYTSAAVQASLVNGYPVYITGFTANDDGHGWVIDGQARG